VEALADCLIQCSEHLLRHRPVNTSAIACRQQRKEEFQRSPPGPRVGTTMGENGGAAGRY